MSKKKHDESISIRLRLEKNLLDRIDMIAGERGRQRFISDAIKWRLDEELPPMFFELSDEIKQLKARIEHLETSRQTSVFLGTLNDVAKNKICQDALDMKMLALFTETDGWTTPELAEGLLGDTSKRRTILDRIDRLNKRAIEHIGGPILEYKKGFVHNKRGAWWLTDPSLILT
ncbi:hypothetical protein EU527_05070 [Candidatus Thorarchaeota archaeon]|nr:MAG: hypothetical protein EU527_05070 [Candidatus Thorarchaeota archaeon]